MEDRFDDRDDQYMQGNAAFGCALLSPIKQTGRGQMQLNPKLNLF
jgi:hypothetical protein